MNSNPRVLSLAYHLIRGGTEGQCARVAMEHARRGLIHRVAAFRREGFFLEPVEELCGPVFEIGITRFLAVDTFRRILSLARYIRREGFTLVHGWDMDSCIFGFVASRLAGVPFIASRRNLAEAMPEYKKRLLRYVDRHSAAVVVNSESIRTVVLRRVLNKSRVVRISNILDVEEFDRLAAAGSFPEWAGKQLVGLVARLEPEKDIQTFIRAAALLSQKNDNLRFVIVGDGKARHDLETLVGALKLTGTVQFLGTRHDIPALVRQFAVGVLTPSSNEGLSNAILEYMAAGIPVVATDCGGDRELVDTSGAGFIVPVGDAAAVAAAISKLLADPNLCREMGRKGRQKVETEHDPANIADEFLALYRTVCAV